VATVDSNSKTPSFPSPGSEPTPVAGRAVGPTTVVRRRLLLGAAGAAAAAASIAGCATTGGGRAGRVVVVGGGYGGATAAKYLRLWSQNRVAVTLVEPNEQFVSCPMSNLVLGGSRTMASITVPYDKLRRGHGVRIVRSTVTSIDQAEKSVVLADGSRLPYDKLVLSPGVDFLYDSLPGLKDVTAREAVLHAWKAGPQTVALRRELEAMRDGGVYALTVPRAPYRCPPGPYERACQVASYFKQAKPKSKVLVFDANEEVTSKPKLFREAWASLYPGIIDYRPNHTLTDVDAAGKRLMFEFNDTEKVDVLNVLPPMRAGDIAAKSGLALANARWCEIDYMTFQAKGQNDIFVVGDSILVAPAMPKSGHMANQHAKVAASAIIAQLAGREPNPAPVLTNTCYSFVSADEVIHVASVHQYDADKKTLNPVAGAGGLSPSRNRMEALTGFAWASNIWADMLG
jgi:NADPH-dependent 2,4-dienoyl-CoA reductase/sulfur reductase-like enzyme